jgi:hypothetical protein
MIIKETGKYKLTEEWSSQGLGYTSNFSAGKILEITQVDIDGKKVHGLFFKDWAPWNIPAIKVGEI